MKTFKKGQKIQVSWEKEKQKERALKAQRDATIESVLDNIPKTLPALDRAYKIQQRCANVGFDWVQLSPVINKIKEELDEVLQEVKRADLNEDQKQSRIEDELGDLLFANVNLVRHLKANPEQVLRHANSKFENRFKSVESIVSKKNKIMANCTLEELDAIW